MTDTAELIQLLTDKDNTRACDAMKELVARSQEGAQVCAFFDVFTALLSHKSSFVRNRALTLLAANAPWAQATQMETALIAYLAHISDPKPITSRICIQGLPAIAASHPQLSAVIRAALLSADPSGYADSMRPLVERDVAEALEQMESAQQ